LHFVFIFFDPCRIPKNVNKALDAIGNIPTELTYLKNLHIILQETMMDFELMNYFIEPLYMSIFHNSVDAKPRLSLFLEGYAEDVLGSSYCMCLTEDKQAILEFLGYDAIVSYDTLSERELFKYLCSSKHFKKPTDIKSCSFKGPRPKNKQHSRFHTYLTRKYPHITLQTDQKEQEIERFRTNALKYFHKEDAYDEYKTHYDILSKVMLLNDRKGISYITLKQFVMLHGIHTLANQSNVVNNEMLTEFLASGCRMKRHLKRAFNTKCNAIESFICSGVSFRRFTYVHGIETIATESNEETIHKWNTFTNENWSSLVVFGV
jgi:hypothetical protein